MQPAFRYKISVHVAGWVVFFIIPLLLSPIHEFAADLRDASNLISMLLRNLLWMGLFYVNLLYLSPVLMKNRGVSTFLFFLLMGVLLVTLINSRVHHFFSEWMQPGFADSWPPGDHLPGGLPPGPPPHRPLDFGPPGPFFSNLIITVMVASVSTSLAFWTEWSKARADEHERALQKISSELAALKLQVSPHFLFNTLNNIRWLVRSRSDQAEEAIVRLSQLLRYMLYQTEASKVSLEGELTHLFDYIALQKLRLAENQSFVFSGIGDARGKMITPLLFIPIVENVFKYGDFQGAFQNYVHVSVMSDKLLLKTENKTLQKGEVTDQQKLGIGLNNVKRRLALDYPGKHTLTYQETDGIFQLELEILF